ncbi:hypothetical protein H0B56_00975 [Haloechinothrix sp. YIM 98757]|uniref:Uncharacterized protein n=1 Tax=Haloechinothrix aidingensis TaxID=2752311 RepID=A0A838A744_9PSEU|nr:DUF6474 family protein [Haloechinothrix aidingensis]MBA0124111.1 hypothetical protein [Haloechinothrix aidingensis]
MGHKHKPEEPEPRITPAKARNAIGVIKVIAPAVIPVLAPLAVRAASALREAYDRFRARRLGVSIDSIGEFSGRGARLHARISGIARELTGLRESAAGDPDRVTFAEESEATLRQLTAAVRAAERMPAARRKAAHAAVAHELDAMENDLLHHLGVS